MGNERRHVERETPSFERGKVIGERGPPPGSALGSHPGMDRRGEVPGFPEERRRSEPAVPDHLGGDPLGDSAGDQRVPIRSAAGEHQIAMGMDVHEPRRGDQTLGVHFAESLPLGRDEAAVADPEVPAARRRPGAVHDQRVPDPVVEGGGVRRTFLVASRRRRDRRRARRRTRVGSLHPSDGSSTSQCPPFAGPRRRIQERPNRHHRSYDAPCADNQAVRRRHRGLMLPDCAAGGADVKLP